MGALSFLVGILLVALSVSAPVAHAQEKTAKPKPAASVAAPINLNTATAAQLEQLPGIGARTAQLIVEHRQKNGNFKKVEELMNVKGIGEKSFLKIKSMVTVGEEKNRPDQSR